MESATRCGGVAFCSQDVIRLATAHVFVWECDPAESAATAGHVGTVAPLARDRCLTSLGLVGPSLPLERDAAGKCHKPIEFGGN